MSGSQRARLLIVEHDHNVARSLQELLTKLGYDVPAVASSAEEALGHVKEGVPDLVLVGQGVEGGMDGIATATQLTTATRLNSGRQVPVVYVSDRDEDAYLERASATHPYGYLLKPYSERGMHATIQMALARRQADEALEKSEQKFRESERRYASLLHNVQLISVMTDRDATITYCNDFFLRMVGWTSEEVLGRNWFDTFVPADDQAARASFTGLLSDLPSAWRSENEILTRAGEKRRVHWSNSVLRAPGGEVVGTASLGDDITERRGAEDEIHRLNVDLERRVAERTSELESANRDLEAYDQMVSHDLRAPARNIMGFATLLLEECGPQLDDVARGYITRVVTATVRMDELVTDLFTLSTVGHAPLRCTDVDLEKVVRSVFQGLDTGGRKIEFVIAPGLVAYADGALVRLLLEHLVGNAVKFTARRAEARIEFGMLKQGDDIPVYFVRDNGAGFEMVDAERLFEPFERAHTQTDFAGTGLGLPTVKRIVARHKGRVWAEAQIDVGATFYFTLTPPAPVSAEAAPCAVAAEATPA